MVRPTDVTEDRGLEALAGLEATYAALPEQFYARLAPTPVKAPRLLKLNHRLARELGLDPASLESDAGVAALAGNRVPAGAQPIAVAYAGHQFGSFNPALGDGRAILLGEIVAPDGVRRDIHLKGSGPTPFSRMGDGRAVVGPVLREYIVSEAMAAMGIPTSRALSAVATGEYVFREGAEPGAVLARVATSHIRIGTFQFFAARQDTDALEALAAYAVSRHGIEVPGGGNPAAALLGAVVERQARLVAQWLNVGFIHGVMNTDNMAVSGETIDYGPCAFMDTYHPATVYSSIDRMGRYAFGNQPHIAHWNLACLAQALLPLLAASEAEAVEVAKDAVNCFPALFEEAWQAGLAAKLGFETSGAREREVAAELLALMERGAADFTLAFRRLSDCLGDDGAGQPGAFVAGFAEPQAIEAWLQGWRALHGALGGERAATRARMNAVNPVYIPRNHLVEEALAAAVGGDLAPFEDLLEVLAKPFEERDGRERFTRPPEPHEVVHQTFCGT